MAQVFRDFLLYQDINDLFEYIFHLLYAFRIISSDFKDIFVVCFVWK